MRKIKNEKNKSKSLLVFSVFLIILCLSCTTTGKITNNAVIINSIDDANYWDKVNPVMFVDTLRKYPGEIFSIDSFPNENWYDEKYIKSLEQMLINNTISNNICAGVISGYISIKPTYKKTNVSDQINYLIKGLKQKRYPPTLTSFN